MSEISHTESNSFRLLRSPECFQNVETGDITEVYEFDGTNIGFLAGEDIVVFNNFKIRFIKNADEVLQSVYLEVDNLPFDVFAKIGAVTGMPVENMVLGDTATVMVRFELLPFALLAMRAAFESASDFYSFLCEADADGEVILWNFDNYSTDAIVSG